MKHKADVNSRTKDFRTPFHIACIRSHLPMVKFLLKQPNVEIDASDYLRNTPLHLCARYGTSQTLEYLLKQQKDRYLSKNSDGKTPKDILKERNDPQLNEVSLLSPPYVSIGLRSLEPPV
jgi:ankyrin repeat protein